jgi:broad specificity phosphatase PhoE
MGGEVKLNNRYFILRHGQTIHQIEKPGITYFWPEDKPPASLTDLGKKQIKNVAEKLKGKKFDLIFSSDVLRTRQTAEIVAKELGLKVKTDPRLRDINWGIYQGKPMKEAWAYYEHQMEKRFEKAPPGGESWLELQKRMVNFLEEIEKIYRDKNILIVSHGDSLWLLDSWAKGLTYKKMIKDRKNGCPMKIGTLKKLN